MFTFSLLQIDQMIALAPVAFFEHAEGAVLRAFAYLASNVDWVVNMIGPGEFLPTNKIITWAARAFCKDDAWTQYLCKNVMFLLCGFDSTNITEVSSVLNRLIKKKSLF